MTSKQTTRIAFSWALILALAFSPLANSVAGQESDDPKQAADHVDDLSRLRPQPITVEAIKIEFAIEKGVKFLLDTQNQNGSWGSPTWTGGVDSDPVPGSFRSFDVAVTALCLEALMGAETNVEVQQARQRGLDFLLSKTGNIKRAGGGDLPNVWANCYCIQVFSKLIQRASEFVPDDEIAQFQNQLRESIKQHAADLQRWESIHGGWFYYGSNMRKPINPSCSFVNGAVLVALCRASSLAIQADQKMVARAIAATKRMQKPDFAYLYTARHQLGMMSAARPINRPAGSLGRSQACNLAMYLWGDEKITVNVFRIWLDRLVTRHGWLDMGRKRPIPHESHAAVAGYFYYFGVYYGALCIEHLPPEERSLYQNHIAQLMLERQEKDGSWFDYPLYSYHKPYGTAFALMTLQACQRQP